MSQIDLKQGGSLQIVKAGASLAAVVKALNALGATPADPQAILRGHACRRGAARGTGDHLMSGATLSAQTDVLAALRARYAGL